jgi:hypothetical protein
MRGRAVRNCFYMITVLLGIFAKCPAQANVQSGELRGTIMDPTGAVIPSARITLIGSNGSSQSAISGHDGSFELPSIRPGSYTASVTSKGFAAKTIEGINIQPGKTLQKNITLQLPIEKQQVEVNEDGLGVSTSAENNASSIVIKGKDLDALSDDPS